MINLTTLTFLLLLIINVLINEISSQDYCTLESCPNGSQTMCKYNSEPADACGDKSLIESGVSSSQQQEILDVHNDRRAYVASGQEKRGAPGPQPAATNLGPLSWDDELAKVAQTWANQCNFNHDQCRNVERFGVGQNIVYIATSNEYPNNMTALILVWYEEVVNLDPNQVYALGDNPAGHYTQLVWADSKYIGCGVINYKKDDYWYTTYLVCNYGPAGNVIGMPIYQVQ